MTSSLSRLPHVTWYLAADPLYRDQYLLPRAPLMLQRCIGQHPQHMGTGQLPAACQCQRSAGRQGSLKRSANALTQRWRSTAGPGLAIY